MWLLNNRTSFAAERTWVRDNLGAEVWVVAVKGSFVVQPSGKQVLDPEQADVSRAPVFRGDPESSSLLFESDLVQTKTRTDVLVEGHAYAPGGKPATTVNVRLKIAQIDKTLRVHGDRRIQAGLLGVKLSDTEPFTRMPITYERSFGGTDRKSGDPKQHQWEPRNPVGVGFARKAEDLIESLAPNIEDPGQPYGSWRRDQPAGFGPIARHWMPRVKLAGTYDDTWGATRKPLLPSDFDERFYQSAPEDQQASGFLRGGELVELHNLTPDGFLSFHLPRVTLGLTTRFYDRTQAWHRADLHTVIIEPDERRFRMVWHSSLPCHHKVNKLMDTTIVLKRRLNVPSAEIKTGMWIGD